MCMCVGLEFIIHTHIHNPLEERKQWKTHRTKTDIIDESATQDDNRRNWILV